MSTRDLSIRLSLTNADAVKSALVELGDRGQGALQLIEAASDRAKASSAKFEAKIRRPRSGQHHHLFGEILSKEVMADLKPSWRESLRAASPDFSALGTAKRPE
jgi:hypothetical protein